MKKINFHNRIFRSISNSATGEVDDLTIFKYQQKENIILGTYSGGRIASGQLIGILSDEQTIEMRYHHINDQGEFKTGKCTSTPEIMPNNKIRLHEQWQWTCDDQSSGQSIIEEI